MKVVRHETVNRNDAVIFVCGLTEHLNQGINDFGVNETSFSISKATGEGHCLLTLIGGERQTV